MLTAATTPAPHVSPARAGTLGLPADPRVPSGFEQRLLLERLWSTKSRDYTAVQAEADLALLGRVTGRDLELLQDDYGCRIFDLGIGDAVGEGATVKAALENAAEEL